MIHVIAIIELKPNCREAYLKVLKDNVPNVKAEAGCLAYEPALDIDSGLTGLTGQPGFSHARTNR